MSTIREYLKKRTNNIEPNFTLFFFLNIYIYDFKLRSFNKFVKESWSPDLCVINTSQYTHVYLFTILIRPQHDKHIITVNIQENVLKLV